MNLNENEECRAIRWIANGSGSWPLENDPDYDEVCVCFPLESLDEVHVFLRKGGRTLQEYTFRIIPGT